MKYSQIPKNPPFYYWLILITDILFIIQFVGLAIFLTYILYDPLQNFIFNNDNQSVILRKSGVIGLLHIAAFIYAMIPSILLYASLRITLFPIGTEAYFGPKSTSKSFIQRLNSPFSKLMWLICMLAALPLLFIYTLIIQDFIKIHDNGIVLQSAFGIGIETIPFTEISNIDFSYRIRKNYGGKGSPPGRYLFIPSLSFNFLNGDHIVVWSQGKNMTIEQGLKIVQYAKNNNISIKYQELPSKYLTSTSDYDIAYEDDLNAYRQLGIVIHLNK